MSSSEKTSKPVFTNFFHQYDFLGSQSKEKKALLIKVFWDQLKICFLFQLLKLSNICVQVIYPLDRRNHG